MTNFSNEELDFFTSIFSNDNVERQLSLEKINLSVETTVPESVFNILGNAKLTLLAKISHYLLYFPFQIEMNEKGEFKPIFGVPEVIDNQLHERSWRVLSPKNVTLHEHNTLQKIDILSLSNSGLTIQINQDELNGLFLKNTLLEIHLPHHVSIKVTLEPVRIENNILAAKFKHIGQENESLRKFLFHLHRSQNKELYKNMAD